MKKSVGFVMGILVPAFILAGVVASPIMAQDKAKDEKAAPAAKAVKGKSTTKLLFENDKVRVIESTFRPGDEAINPAQPFRLIRVLKGGTMQYTYPDGKTEKIEWKTGDVKGLEPTTAAPKNVGKTNYVAMVVYLKEPKK
jgi:hypothetical protein